MKTNMTTVSNTEINKHSPEKMDWGMRYIVDTEFEALRIGYNFRKNLYGYKIEFHSNSGKYATIIWNKLAETTGLNK